MKFTMTLSDGESEWGEEYTINTTDPEKEAQKMVDFFNRTLKPYEKPRKLISVTVHSETNDLHEWEKDIRAMSVTFRGRNCDIMYCRNCGITGKRYGLASKITVDSKYRGKAYRYCSTARKQFEQDGSL